MTAVASPTPAEIEAMLPKAREALREVRFAHRIIGERITRTVATALATVAAEERARHRLLGDLADDIRDNFECCCYVDDLPDDEVCPCGGSGRNDRGEDGIMHGCWNCQAEAAIRARSK